ncbi:MAG: hypothetical protein HZB98_02635 [Bacteroidia bacterium]|nr:hypothetical protein [Bacteroidia bacterium]
MKQRQEFETDQLKKYMTRADTERAPEGFTDKLMIQIRMETATNTHSSAPVKRGLIPIFSTGITVLLILTLILLPGAESVSPVFSWLGKLDQINSIMTGIRFKWTFSISLPEIMGYLTVSIFLLLIFDRSLSRFFRHET